MKKALTLVPKKLKANFSIVILLSAFALSTFFSYSQNCEQKNAVAFKITYSPKNKSQKAKFLEREFGNYFYFYCYEGQFVIVRTFRNDTLRVTAGFFKDTVSYVRFENDPYFIKRQKSPFYFLEKQQDELPVFVNGENCVSYFDSENHITVFFREGQPPTNETMINYLDLVRMISVEKDYTMTMDKINDFQFTNFPQYFNYDDLMIITPTKECINFDTIYHQLELIHDCLKKNAKFPNLLTNKGLEAAIYLIFVIDTNGRLNYAQIKPAYFKHDHSIDYIYNPRRIKRYTRRIEKRFLKAFNACAEEQLFQPPKSETGLINIRINTKQVFSFYSHFY